MKAPVHYWHNALHGGSHNGGMSAVGPFCVVHTHVHQVWSMSPTSYPHLLPSLQGAKVFHLSGLIHSQYPEVELHSLGRVFSVRKCTPLESRTTHPYMLLDGEWCHLLLTGLICMSTCRWSDSGHMQVT